MKRSLCLNVKISAFGIPEINIKIINYTLDHYEESLSGIFFIDTPLFLANHTSGLLPQ